MMHKHLKMLIKHLEAFFAFTIEQNLNTPFDGKLYNSGGFEANSSCYTKNNYAKSCVEYLNSSYL